MHTTTNTPPALASTIPAPPRARAATTIPAPPRTSAAPNFRPMADTLFAWVFAAGLALLVVAFSLIFGGGQ